MMRPQGILRCHIHDSMISIVPMARIAVKVNKEKEANQIRKKFRRIIHTVNLEISEHTAHMNAQFTNGIIR